MDYSPIVLTPRNAGRLEYFTTNGCKYAARLWPQACRRGVPRQNNSQESSSNIMTLHRSKSLGYFATIDVKMRHRSEEKWGRRSFFVGRTSWSAFLLPGGAARKPLRLIENMARRDRSICESFSNVRRGKKAGSKNRLDHREIP
jgi:hypothetical protein